MGPTLLREVSKHAPQAQGGWPVRLQGLLTCVRGQVP